MKIALVHYTYTPVIGGVEFIMAEHARLFAAEGHQVTVFCRRGGSADPRIRVQLLPLSGDSAEFSRALKAEFAMQDVIIVHNVATMHFHLALTEALLDLSRKVSGPRFIAWIHDLAACNPDYQLTDASRELVGRSHESYEYVAVSELRRRQFEEFTGSSCQVIPNGIDSERILGLTPAIAELSRAHRLLERDIVLLHPARLLRRKNVELGLRVAAALKQKGKDCAYLVTAPPDPHNAATRIYADELRASKRELGLEDDAIFVQEELSVGERDLAALYALADALFFPSRQEGFGLPVLEAAMHRLPIFCADIAPLDSLLDRGVTFFPLDAEPAHIALNIIDRLDSLEASQARNQTRRAYGWPSIYRRCLAPLLTPSEAPLPL